MAEWTRGPGLSWIRFRRLPRERVLDFACGSGLLGAWVTAREPTVSVDFLDVDAVALEAVEANVPGANRTPV